MTATSKRASAARRSEIARPPESSDSRPFILTLCRLAAPIAIPQPRAPHLKGLTFFTSRSRSADGRDQWLLHAGHFVTAASAQECLERLRALYPKATVHTASTELLREYGAGIPTLKPADVQGGIISDPLTDSQVLQLLEQRHTESHVGLAEATKAAREIPLRRPDDRQTRQALKEALLQNEPVSFAVQLLWSVQPIDLTRVPALQIFRAYTLYMAESRRDRRTWYCLRLGFFNDPTAAKQVARFIRSSFASVAVVPVSEEEQMRAKLERIRPSGAAAHLA
jgi:hypothetical protein